MTTKEMLKQFVESLDETQAAEALDLLRERYDISELPDDRRLPFIGALTAEPDFAERSEEILRGELGRAA
jgi:hypothetical protein